MIDIVTINKDNKDGLLQTILSVISQTKFDEINYIIIDGGSTDGSKEIIKKYKNLFGYSTSRQDKGIYNAFNKALSHLKGEYVLFLNSGDYLASATTIEQVLKYLHNEVIIYGDQMLSGNKKLVNLAGVKIMVHSDEVVATNKTLPDKLNEDFFRTNSLPHQATFIKTEYMKEHPYSEEYRIIGDWKLLREAIIDDKVSYKHMPVTVSYFALNGTSSKDDTYIKEKTDYYKTIDK